MSNHDEEQLTRAAEAVADGEQLGDEAETSASRELSGKLHHLRTIADISRLHRTLSGEPGPIDSVGEELATADADDPENVFIPTRMGSLSPTRLRRWASLTIKGKLHEGDSAELFLAHDPELGRHVSLKLLRVGSWGGEAGIQNLVNDAKILASIDHPHVLKVHGAEVHKHCLGIWTDLIEADTLEQHLRRSGPLTAEETIDVGLSLCRALRALHAAGLIHGDVRCNNARRERSGHIVLMDFGLTRRYRRVSEGELVSGPMSYAAPELFGGEAPSVPSDLYSLGVILHHLTTGSYPVDGESRGEIMRQHRKGLTISLRDARPDLSESFVDVVAKALSPAPEDRFQSAGEMERALTESIEAAQPASRLGRWRRWIPGR